MESYCSLCTLDTIHRLVVVTILIIDQINKVQWVDFKLENVLVSLHSLKTMGLLAIYNECVPNMGDWRAYTLTINIHYIK